MHFWGVLDGEGADENGARRTSRQGVWKAVHLIHDLAKRDGAGMKSHRRAAIFFSSSLLCCLSTIGDVHS